MIAGGGTGGHIFPGVAVADEFSKTATSPRVLFVGSNVGMESKLVPQAGYSLYLIPAGGIKGKNFAARLLALLKLPLGFIEAIRIIISFNPDVVLGVGGYAAAAVCICARLFGIPVAIQEQNSVPGLTNRLLGKIAQRIFTAFPVSEKFFPTTKVIESGNPIRAEILAVAPLTAKDLSDVGTVKKPLHILIFGGSQGASALNRAMIQALGNGELKELQDCLVFTHQSGEKELKLVQSAYQEAGFTANVQAFFPQMHEVYGHAHLVIARSGASILEIAATGRPSVLIPYPNSADNHQQANAEVFRKAGASIVVTNSDFNGKRCAELIRSLYKEETRLLGMGQAAYSLCKRQAATQIAAHCIGLIQC
jgi:UDP-N-acetylglucosamine--N-acetylmuramyl-(pentapeptide) pyrophosphoryl-undecaprenol N-acetylglucosamine transferase